MFPPTESVKTLAGDSHPHLGVTTWLDTPRAPRTTELQENTSNVGDEIVGGSVMPFRVICPLAPCGDSSSRM